MAPMDHSAFDDELDEIDRKNWGLWVLNGLLLMVMAAVITSLYLPQVWGLVAPDMPAPETRGMLVTGMCGLVAIFMLYMLLKQRQMVTLRGDLFRSRMKEEILRSRLGEITSLFDMSTSVNMQFTVDSILDIITRRVLTCLEADQSSILMLDPDTQTLNCRAVHGVDSDFVRDASIKLGEGIAGYVASNGEPMVINPEDITRRFSAHRKPGRNITSALCIPLMVKGRAIGVLNINRIDRDRPFSAGDARVLAVFGEHAAVAIQKVEDYRALDSRASLLEEANRRLSEINRMKEVFLTTVSHELKTPLTCIIAYAEFLRQDDTSVEPEQRRTFSRILYDQASRLLDLVNDIMDLSRIEGGATRLNLSTTPINEVVESCMLALETLAVRKGIRLEQKLAPRLPDIPIDASKLRQVVINLLNNAVKFTESGGTIEIATRLLDDHVVVEVSDSGIGIAARDLTRIFDLFTRSDIAVSRQYEGLGLGLHLVKRLVELHGGRIWVESTPGKGSRFFFSLPVGRITAAPVEDPAGVPSTNGTHPALPAPVGSGVHEGASPNEERAA
ncbi:MAG: GAF domain-containing sensor histidine kinase [Candidatus Eisenbacteria bacterium]